jgi:hypothetical protein
MVPFLKSEIYGRSPLENSSFLVSSVHPDKLLHGAGFVARLSGASAEFLSMWTQMMAGIRPFFMQGEKLFLAFRPILPSWLFAEDNTATYKFLGRTMVTYHNPKRRDTFDPHTTTRSIVLHHVDGNSIELNGGIIPAPYAERVREGQVKQIDVYFT